MTNGNVGTQAVLWSAFGAEALDAVYDLRWMLALGLGLIVVDFWWGVSDARSKGEEVRFSRAGRRTCNKMIDYLCYLIVGCLLGLAIFEPLGMCTHITTSAVGIGLGCLFDLNSIIGHVCSVHGLKWKLNLWTFLLKLMEKKHEDVAEAIEASKEEVKVKRNKKPKEISDETWKEMRKS